MEQNWSQTLQVRLIRVADMGVFMGKFSRSQKNIETMDEHHFEMIHGESLMFLYLLQGETLFTFVPDNHFKDFFFNYKWLYKMELIFPSGSNMRFLYCLHNKGNVSL